MSSRGVIKNFGYNIQNQVYYIRTLKICRGVNKLLGFITKFLAFSTEGGHKIFFMGYPPDPPTKIPMLQFWLCISVYTIGGHRGVPPVKNFLLTPLENGKNLVIKPRSLLTPLQIFKVRM